MRRSKGYSKTVISDKGKFYGRLRVKQPDGTLKTYYTRQARTKTDARELLKPLEERYRLGGTASLDAESMRFTDLVAEFKKSKLIPAVYDGERKVAGYKQPKTFENRIDRLEKYFRVKLIKDILPKDIEAYKNHLLTTPTRFGRPRTIYDTNHQLRTLRIVLNFARVNRWIMENPFTYLPGIINAADELPRQREERQGEFETVFAACDSVRRLHLRYWIITAVETAARPAELDRIERQDLLFDERLIRLRVRVTKTQVERFVPMSDLLYEHLQEWMLIIRENRYWARRISNDPTSKVFGGYNSNKVAWRNMLEDINEEEVKIVDLKRKDLRHWGTTRLVAALARAGISDKHAMQITGHTQEKTFRRYITTDKEVVRDAGRALDELRRVREQENESQINESETVH